MLYVDDGAFVFETRQDLEKGVGIIWRQFAKFALEMHTGTETKTSKTEFFFFPPPIMFKQCLLHQQSKEEDETSGIATIPKTES